MQLLPILLLAACAKSLDPGNTEDTSPNSTVSPGEAVVDATSDVDFVYLDLESSAMVTPANPADDASWDLAFRRYKIPLNGGVSGTGGMQIVPLAGADYNAAIETPTDGWVTDQADADGDGDLEYAFDTWFSYDSETHEVTAADYVYVVQSVEKSLYKLQFLSYYDDAGTGGYIGLHWGPLDDTWTPPVDTGDTGGGDGMACTADATRVQSTVADTVTTTTLDTTSVDDFVCWSFAAGAVTEAWDLAMQKWTILTPDAVAALPAQDFDALTVAPADGYVTDDGSGSAFADWYDYDAVEHTILPKDMVYVVHPADGPFYKMQFLSYYPDGDTTQPHHPSFRWATVQAPAK